MPDTWALMAILVAAGLAGGLALGRWRGRRDRTAVQAPAFAVPDDVPLPDWTTPDTPLLDLPQIEALLSDIAARAGIDRAHLPAVKPADSDWGAFIEREAAGYLYLDFERGGPMFLLRTAVVDQLLYWVFRDRARAIASNVIAGKTRTEDYAARLREEQQRALFAIEPRWAAYLARGEQARDGGQPGT